MKKLFGRGGPLGVFAEYPVLARLALICVCAETAWATLLIVMEFYFKEELLRDFSPQFIASKVATTFLAFVGMETLCKYPMGRLADKYGPRPFVLLSLGIGTVTPILMYFFGRAWWHFIPLRAIDGFAAAALWPAMSALMTRAVPREAKAASMSVFNAAYMLGLALGPMTGLFIGHISGSNINVFPFCGAIMFIGLIISLLTLNSILKSQPNSSTQTVSNAEPHESLLRGKPILWKMMALYAISQIGTGILAPTVPIYLDTQFGIKQANLSVILFIPALLIAAIAIPLGRLPDKIGRARAVWISYGMAASGMFLAALTGHFAPTNQHQLLSLSPLLFGLGMLLFIGSFILGTPAWLGLASLQVSDKKQAQVLSLMQTAQGVGVVIAFLLVASAGHLMTQWHKVGARVGAALHRQTAVKLHDTVPLSVWFWVSCALFVLCLIGTLYFVHEPPHHEHDEKLAREAESTPFADRTNA